MLGIDWNALFVPQHSLAEIVLRGTIIYLGLFLALRFLLKRNAGELGIADLLVIVLLSEATQNAMGSELESVTEAAVLVGTVLFWSHALNWVSYRFPAFRFLTGAAPVELVKDGRVNRRALRREMITMDELMSQVREQGVDDLAKVRSVCLEGDGNFSVIRADDGEVEGAPTRAKGA